MKDRFIKAARGTATDLRLIRFATFTLPAEARHLATREAWHEISRVWAAFRKRIARVEATDTCGCRHCRGGCVLRASNGRPALGPLTSIWVRELHKNGTPHLHVLVDRFICQEWMSRTWAACGGGEVVDIRRATIENVVAYVTKYLAKSLSNYAGRPGDPLEGHRGLRRYGTTGDAEIRGVYPEKRGDDVWWVEARTPEHTMQARVVVRDGLVTMDRDPVEIWRLVWPWDVGKMILEVTRTYGEPAPVDRWHEILHCRIRTRQEQRERHLRGQVWRIRDGRILGIGPARQGLLSEDRFEAPRPRAYWVPDQILDGIPCVGGLVVEGHACPSCGHEAPLEPAYDLVRRDHPGLTYDLEGRPRFVYHRKKPRGDGRLVCVACGADGPRLDQLHLDPLEVTP